MRNTRSAPHGKQTKELVAAKPAQMRGGCAREQKGGCGGGCVTLSVRNCTRSHVAAAFAKPGPQLQSTVARVCLLRSSNPRRTEPSVWAGLRLARPAGGGALQCRWHCALRVASSRFFSFLSSTKSRRLLESRRCVWDALCWKVAAGDAGTQHSLARICSWMRRRICMSSHCIFGAR